MKLKKITALKGGFTLIELLVVIAIIGILSSVILASLNNARNRGSNAAVKSNLNGIRSQAEIVYDNNNQDYTNVCSDQNIGNAINSAIAAGGDTGAVIATRCNSNVSSWAVNVKLKVPEGPANYWCIDTLGNAKGEAAELAGATACS